MKIIVILFSLLILSSFALAESDNAQSRSNGLLRFIAQQHGLRDFALSTMIGKRCTRYMDNAGKAPCRDAVKKMVEVLDYDVIFSDDKGFNLPFVQGPDENWTPKSFVFVAFKKNLIQLLSSPNTATYLYDLNQNLYKFLVDNKSTLNIWDFTKSYYKTDYSTAMAMAALFQDTSAMKLHLAYLERAGVNGNSNFHSNKELLSRVIDTVNLILDASEEHYRELFYPKEIVKNVNRNIYHFYVPLYLSMTLKKSGIQEKYSYSAALMLTLTYEFITSSSDYRFIYLDPYSIEPNQAGIWKMKDIFGGYCGSNFGVRGLNFNKNFEIIKESFARSTEDAVHLLLRH